MVLFVDGVICGWCNLDGVICRWCFLDGLIQMVLFVDGAVAVSSITYGLFMLQPNWQVIERCHNTPTDKCT